MVVIRPVVVACGLLLGACVQKPLMIPAAQVTAAVEANNKAEIFFRQGDLNRAAQYYGEALRIARAIEDVDGVAANAINLSIVYQRQGKIDLARSSLALISDGVLAFSSTRLAQASLRLAILDFDERKYATAAEAVEKALKGCITQDCSLLPAIHNLKGRIVLETGQQNLAAVSAQAAMNTSKQQNNRMELANAFRLLGDSAFRSGNLRESLLSYEEALRIDTELAEPGKIYRDHVALGNATASMGDRDIARAHYKRALSVSEASRDGKSMDQVRRLIKELGAP